MERGSMWRNAGGAIAVLAAVGAVWLTRGHVSNARADADRAATPADVAVPAPPGQTETTRSGQTVTTPPPTTAAPTGAPPAAADDEATFMARLRGLAGRDPASAVALAREGSRRFGESADAPERAAILIHALASEGRAMEARGEAEEMVNRYPDSAWVRDVELFTGAHRHRNVRLNEAGALEYYDPR